MTSAARRALRWALWIGVAVALVAFVRAIDWRETWGAVRRASPWLMAAAAVVNLGSLGLKGVRWWVFLRPIGVSLSLSLRATFSGAALNNLLVANSGDAARVLLVSNASGVGSALVLATLALERLFDLVGYVILLALAAVLLPLPDSLASLKTVAFATLVVIAIGLALLLRAASGAGVQQSAEGPVTTGGRVRAYLRNTVLAIRAASTGPRFGAALALSIAAWVLQFATYHLTAMAVGFPATFTHTIAGLLAVNVAFAVRTTPGGVGVFQVIYAMTMSQMGLDRDQATAVALLIQVQQVLPVTAVGLVLTPGGVRTERASTST